MTIDVLRYLQRKDGQWKIVAGPQPAARTDADGTLHIAGCAGAEGGSP